MRYRQFASLVLSVFLLSSLTFAQKTVTPDPEAEKKKQELDAKVVQMLNQAISDAQMLRLPQNRAIVYTLAGDLYWKFDEKRSRDLFKAAANEILAYNADIEMEKRDSSQPTIDILDGGDPRAQVIPLIAKNDAELAFELLIQTRSAALNEALQKASAPDAASGNEMFEFNGDRQRVRQEIALEQRFAMLAADHNPDRAIKLIKESLAKGVSQILLPLLRKLHQKDDKKAAELAGDVIRKLVDSDLTKKNEELQVALSFLQVAGQSQGPPPPEGKEKPFRFTDAQAKDLATKLANTFLQTSNSLALSSALSRAMPTLEKLVPEKIALLKQKQAERQRSLPTEFKNLQRQERLWDPNSTPEQILAEIPKIKSQGEKNAAYQSLAGKIGRIEDEARARRLIDQIPDEGNRQKVMEQFESAKIERTAATGKLDEARKLIDNLTSKKAKIQKLVGLATQSFKKGSEAGIETANDLMKNARALLNEVPEDEEELGDLMEVVKGYAIVEPEIGFRMFEPMVDQFNDLIMASAILSKYNKRNRTFKKGELIMRASGVSFDGLLVFRYINQMQLLGKADLERMSLMSDRFQRSDSRTLIKLLVIQGFMKDDKTPEMGAPPTGVTFTQY